MGQGDTSETFDREGTQVHQGIDVQPIHQFAPQIDTDREILLTAAAVMSP